MHTPQESTAFLAECDFALEHIFIALRQREDAIRDVARQVEELERKQEGVTSLFVDRDQWSPNANYYYGRYVQRMTEIAAQKDRFATPEALQQRLDEALARIGASEQAMAVLAGAALQLGKQALSFRHGRKPQLPAPRMIGTQSVVDVIWEGRNHALHWEEANPRGPVAAMLVALTNDVGARIVQGENNATVILNALGWKSKADVLADLAALVS